MKGPPQGEATEVLHDELSTLQVPGYSHQRLRRGLCTSFGMLGRLLRGNSPQFLHNSWRTLESGPRVRAQDHSAAPRCHPDVDFFA